MRARLTLLDYAMHQQTERSGERPLVQDLLFGKEKRKGESRHVLDRDTDPDQETGADR